MTDAKPTTTPTTEIPQPKPRKISKNEKKFKKAMTRMGMKPVEGITRVTLKTNKNFILYIDGPEVLKNAGAEESYVIFGEAKFLDFTKNAVDTELNKFKNAEDAVIKEEVNEEDKGEGETEDAGDIKEETITTLIEYASCTRAQAISALKKTGGDLVEAITLVS